MSITPPPAERAIIAAYRTHTGATQIQIVQLDAADCGFGHRLAGPKHGNMGTTTLVERTLNTEDAREIRSVLDAAFPPAAPAPADALVFELRAGTDAEPDHVATYATEQGAAAHGEHEYRAARGTAADLEWRPTGDDDNPRYRLVAVDDLDGEETDTDWHIVQVTVPAAYTPAGGERA